MTHHIAIVGAGTAGIIAASYIKSKWKDKVKITLIYDHKNPGIGVGESTTPLMLEYLQTVNITPDELIKNTNSTIKLGIKFKNWLNDGNHYYHGFHEMQKSEEGIDYNESYAYEVVQNTKFMDVHYDSYYYDNNFLPAKLSGFALHINTLTFSNYVQSVFKDRLNIVDGVVKDVVIKDEKINHIVLENGEKIEADFFIDATGFSRQLIKNLNPTWIDKSKYIPNNRAIPFHINKEYDYIPPYTLAEASSNGWIWQIPLSHRFGSGYLFSNKFTSDEDARNDYNDWLIKNHDTELDTDAIIEFDSGYYENQWIGNCVCIGLSSGFVEPLESTSVHTSILQSMLFCLKYPLTIIESNVKFYNRYFVNIFEEIYDFIRYHYYTKRIDSPFWMYMTKNTPDWIAEFDNKIQKDFLRADDFVKLNVFDYSSYCAVSYGLNIFNEDNCYNYLKNRELYESGKYWYEYIKSYKFQNRQNGVDHKKHIMYIVDRGA